MNNNFDATAGNWELTLTGTDFPTTTEGIDFFIGTKRQTVKSITATSAVVTVTDISDLSFSGAKIYFPVGKPKGSEVVGAQVTLTPKLMQISPNSGSTGGSLITATIMGVGTQT
jgi:hypothetical protein